MPISCPCTGQTCTAWVCNEGGWPCDPAPMQALRTAAASLASPAPPSVEDTEDGRTLAVEIQEDEDHDGEVDF